MKKDQIIVAAILAFLATLMVTSAQAGPLVFSNGVQLTDVQIVERQKEGKLPAIVGNSYYEDGKFVMASDSKNPTVRKVQKVREAIRERQENQDQKRIDRAPAEAARAAAYKAAVEAAEARKAAWEALGNTKIEWSERSEALYNEFIEGFLAKEYFDDGLKISDDEIALRQVAAAEWHDQIIGATYAENEAFLNGTYGVDSFTRDLMQAGVNEINAIMDDAEHYQAIRFAQGHVTYAIKLNTPGGTSNWDLNGDDYHIND